MSERNLARNKGRTINTSFSFFVSAVLILTVFMVVFSANLFEIDKLDKSNNYDYEFYNDSLECNVPYEILDKILGLDSVEKIAWGRRGFDEFWESRDEVGTPRSESSKGVEIRVYSDAVLERLCAGNSIDYTKWKDKPYCLLVNDSASDSNSLLLYDAQGKEKIVELNGNISDDFYCDYYAAGICIVMNENAAKQLYSEGYDYNVLFIKSAKKTACIEDVNALLGTYGITMIYNDLGVNSEDARAQLTSIICIIIYLLFCVCIMTATNLICNINGFFRIR